MRMRNAIIVVSGLLGACGGGGGDPAADERAIAALVPPEAVVCVRLASVDALAAGLGEVARAGGFDGSHLTSDALLSNLGMLGVDGTLVARDRPVGFALVAKRATPPQPVLMLPAKDPARLQRSFTDRGSAAGVHGDYVAVALTGKYEKPAAPSPLTASLPTNLIVARVDVDRLWANLGVMIQSGLDLGRAAMKQEAPPTPGFDMDAMFDAYFGVVRTALTAGESCELRLDLSDQGVGLAGSFVGKAGSELDGWSSAPIDLAPFAATMPGKSTFDMLMVVDWAALWPRFEPFMEAMLQVYPEAMRPVMQKFMRSYRDVYEAMGPVIAGSFDMAPSGFRGDLHMAPKDAKDLATKMNGIMADKAFGELGYTFTPEPLREEGGLVQQVVRAKIDFAKLMANMAPNGVPDQAAAQKQAAAMVERMFGKDGLRLGFAARGQRAVVTLGEGTDAPALLDRTGGSWSPALHPTIAFLGGCNPQVVMRVDMAAAMRAGAEMAGVVAPPAGQPANFVMGAGVKDRDWRFLLQFDLGFLKANSRR